MYKVMVFLRNKEMNFMVQHKDEGLAKSAVENVKERIKSYIDTGLNNIVTLTGDDYGSLEFLASEIVGVAIMFQAEAIQIPGNHGLVRQ